MTASTEQLRKLLASVRFVLWDLDGPICRLFAGHKAHVVARELVALIDQLGLGKLLTQQERSDRDPQAILLAVSRRRPGGDLIADLERWLTEQELRAVPKALPTAYADPLIRTWLSFGVRFAVTTNNSARAATAYLEGRGLADCFPFVYGRTKDLSLMKPDPHCLRQAITAMGAEPTQTVMLGDAPTDYTAAQEAGVSFIGYARNSRKSLALVRAGVGSSNIVSSLESVLVALKAQA